MAVNGFLLGAGASFELGMPLTDELSMSFRNGLLKNIDSPYYKSSPDVRTLIEPLLQNKQLNYEEIMGRIEIEIQRNRGGAQYQELYGLLGRYNEAIYLLLLEIHKKNLKYFRERLDLVKPLTKFCSDSPLWTFSLNHDVVFEMIARYLNIPVKFGFNSRIDINGIMFEKLSRDDMNNNRFSFFQAEQGINLVRLHGAIDLFTNRDEKDYLKIIGGDKYDGIISKLSKLLNDDVALRQYGVRATNEITFNDEKGVLQFLRMTIMSGKHKFSSRIQHTLDDWFLKIFRGHINYVTNLYCIGYSFGDSHINDVLYDWLSFDAGRKLTIVDPYVLDVPLTFRHIREQVSLKKMGFLEFLNENSDEKIKARVRLYQEARNLSRQKNLNAYRCNSFAMMKLYFQIVVLSRKIRKLT
jgi:hypothetical protein